MPDPRDHLARLRRADSQVKAARVRAALDAMAAGEPPGVSQLARRARVSRRFIYDHPELRAEIAHRARQVAGQCAGVVIASLRADLENAKARNRRLESDLAASRRRLGEASARTSSARSAPPGTPARPSAPGSSNRPTPAPRRP